MSEHLHVYNRHATAAGRDLSVPLFHLFDAHLAFDVFLYCYVVSSNKLGSLKPLYDSINISITLVLQLGNILLVIKSDVSSQRGWL